MKLYDTLTGQKRELVPLGDVVKVYVCGINPYAPAHVGHALSYVSFDVLRRYLEFRGYQVLHVQNFTDVEDNIIAAAKRAGITITELTERYILEFFQDMDALNVTRAHVYPKATEEVPQIIEMVAGLVDKGYAYPVNGDVYFRVTRFHGYGKLSHRTLDGMMAGARIEVEAQKEHAMDFVLWKAAKPEEPSWESPWGPGRPGWHIECSAMNLHHLGEQVDIHGGGQDLVFPHHENEIAQIEAFTGVNPFSGFWLHNGLLRLDEAKMSKSLGNLVTVRDALEQFSPDALRLYFLSSHYRNPLAYGDDSIAGQERAADRLRQAAAVEDAQPSGEAADPEPFRRRFIEAMDDDLNTPQALAVLFDLAREINRGREAGRSIAGARESLRELSGVLGLTLETPRGSDSATAPLLELLEEFRAGPAADPPTTAESIVDLLVARRTELRAERQFEAADRIRHRLQELGVGLEDSAQGTRWSFR